MALKTEDLLRNGMRRHWVGLVVAAAVLAAAVVGVPAGHAGAQSTTGEVAVSSGYYGDKYEIPRRAAIYVFGFIRDGTMMVPVRPVAEAYGATVHWVAGVGTLVNGRLVETTAVLGQAYSPAKELARVLGCWLEWNQVGRTVILSNGVQEAIVSVPQGSQPGGDLPAGEAWSTAGRSGAGDAGHGAADAGPETMGAAATTIPLRADSAPAATTAAPRSAGPGAVARAVAGPGTMDGAAGGAGAGGGPRSWAGTGTGGASAAGMGSGGDGLATPGGEAVSGTVPGVFPVTVAAAEAGIPGSRAPAGVARAGEAPQPGAPVVTIVSITPGPSTGSPAAPDPPGGPGGKEPVVEITPLPGHAMPPGEGPGEGGTVRRGPGGRISAGRIALTFDDGPDAVYTKKILAVLDRYRVKATFFLIGSQVERHAAVVREIAAAGHEMGNHGYSHSRLTTLSAEAARREISRTQEAIKAVANVTPRWFRPPYGSYNDEIRQIAKQEGAWTVLWTLNPDDWRNPGQAAIVRRVISGAKDGAIVLLHVREQTALALPALIEGLTSLGYDLVPLSGLSSADGGRPALRTGGGQDGAGGAGSPPEPVDEPQGAAAGPGSGTGVGAAADAVTGATDVK